VANYKRGGRHRDKGWERCHSLSLIKELIRTEKGRMGGGGRGGKKREAAKGETFGSPLRF